MGYDKVRCDKEAVAGELFYANINKYFLFFSVHSTYIIQHTLFCPFLLIYIETLSMSVHKELPHSKE